ncbi:MAG: type IV pilus assembly protein PilM [Planctomycetaceae bacterium]|nr:type IV pilus assembly protein PilM [Planctomycetaceae bacterium]
MSLLTKKKTEVVGLDVGSRAVKLVRLSRNERGYCVTAAAICELAAAAGGSDEARAAKAIGECLSRAEVRERSAVCAAAGTEVMIRGFKFPPLPLKALDQAVLLEAQSVCPLDMKTSVLDYQLVETEGQNRAEPGPHNGLMVVGTQRLINQRISALTAARVKPVLMDAEALALLNCLTELNLVGDSGTVAVIDIGWSKSSVIIYGQNGLPFVRDLNVAGGSIIGQISGEQGLSESDVQQILCDAEAAIGGANRNKTLLSLNNAIRPMVMMINETLRFYAFQEKSSAVEKIFLCGGFSQVPMFRDMLMDALPAEAEVLNPMDHIEWQTPAEQNGLKACGPVLAIATGLAMRTV